NDEGDFAAAAKILELPGTGLKAQADKRSAVLKTPSGQSIAGTVYNAALKTYVGKGDLKKAEEILKKIGGGSTADPVNLTKLYLHLSKQMLDELAKQRLGGGSNESLKGALEGLGNFIETAASRKEGNTMGAMSWLAEQLMKLAQDLDAVGARPGAQAQHLYEKAASVLTKILDRAKADPKFADERSVLGTRVRLATCQRRLGPSNSSNFQSAIDQLTIVVKKFPKNLEAQKAAALTFEEWAVSTTKASDKIKHYDAAVNGTKTKRRGTQVAGEQVIWGWAQLTKTTRLIPKYKQEFYYARTHWIRCRARAAFQKKDAKELAEVERQIVAMHRTNNSLGGLEYYEDLDGVLQGLQAQLKKDVKSFRALEAEYAKRAQRKK
ncbi:MAG: hypothetical protein N2C14_17825, partial [Planctomycetales bacterium]